MASSSSSATAASSSSSSKKLTLESSDKVLFEISENVAVQSLTIKNLLEELGDYGGNKIPLPNVTGSTLGKIVEYCNKYHDDLALDAAAAIPPREVDSGIIKPWEKEFIDVDQNTLFDLIYAANYLDIKSLLELTCQTVANMMKRKTPEQIREHFHIKNDYTPEEEEEVRRECQWAFGHQN